ncbi:hypothetical protein ACE2AJ_12075 [Aquihabitans daechungensis]|uniref:hypothetical protein n=1 Tax=Aquihabitans daechungensis TaxID=1052257 RepID=UPI003BA17CDC
MNTAAKLGAYGACLAVVFGGAFAVGDAVGEPTQSATPASHGTGHGTDHTVEEPASAPAGLSAQADGYELELDEDRTTPDASAQLEFRIVGPDGKTVDDYDVEHDKELHLIVVRRDLSGYQHVHPVRADDGTWSTTLDLSAAGTYRVLADFTPAGHDRGLTLGTDLTVDGDATPTALPAPALTAEVDGYEVTLEGQLVPGQTSPLTLTVSRNGEPVDDLQPYLAAYGHLVALRTDDLAYLHVHPDGAPGDGETPAGPGITFYAEVPTADSYRLFLDFRHGDEVHTAEFTAFATAPSPDDTTTNTSNATTTEPAPAEHGSDGHGHPGEGS